MLRLEIKVIEFKSPDLAYSCNTPKVAFSISEEKASEINLLIENGTINSSNYKASLSKMTRLAKK